MTRILVSSGQVETRLDFSIAKAIIRGGRLYKNVLKLATNKNHISLHTHNLETVYFIFNTLHFFL